jgi:peptidoglycan/xylan/chitin deacetylase (PgdA/CDA1 family)
MQSLLIWTYHRILPEPAKGAVDCATFEKQIAFLKKSGYEFLDTAGLEKWLNKDLDPKKKYTVLTFDDGWADNLIWATPILKNTGTKAVMAVNTSLLNPEAGKNREDSINFNAKDALEDAVYGRSFDSFLTWDELGEIKESGVWDIQAHGNSHLGCYHDLGEIRGFYPEFKHWTMEYALGEPPFDGAPRAEFKSILSAPRTVLSNELKEELKKASSDSERLSLCQNPNAIKVLETDEEFKKRVKEDLLSCKKQLEERLGIETKSFFWPWGHSSKENIETALECGFEMLFTMRKDSVNAETNRHDIPRIAAPETLKRLKKQETVFSNRLLKSLRNIFSKSN